MPDLTYTQLAKATADLAKNIARNTDQISIHAAAIREEAVDTARIADSIAALNVDRATVAETSELAKAMNGVGDAAANYAALAAATAKSAQAAHDQNRASHQGIGEAISRSSVGNEIYDMDRTWLTQE